MVRRTSKKQGKTDETESKRMEAPSSATQSIATTDTGKQLSQPQSVLSTDGMIGIVKELCGAVRLSNGFPGVKQFQFLGLTNIGIAKKRTQTSKRLCKSMSSISVGYGVSLALNANDEDETDSICSLNVDDMIFDRVTQSTDEALDYFNRALDNAQGIEDAAAPLTGGLNHVDAKRLGLKSTSLVTGGSNPAGKNGNQAGANLSQLKPLALEIEKPQVRFPDYPIDNSPAPFVPPYLSEQVAKKLEVKHPHLRRNRESGEHVKKEKKVCADESVISYGINDFDGDNELEQPHPFEDEIEHYVEKMRETEFEPLDAEQMKKPVGSKPLIFVETEGELKEVADRLNKATELAVDLEHHSVRSFQGFVCLMQISTRNENIIIDTLAVRGHIHKYLHPIFIDGNIVKVLHGADRDVQWLQRDFGIYVVNLFDTGQAARLLLYPSASLVHLQIRFLNRTLEDNRQMKITKKKYQLSDWRKRPLSADMLQYARDDTHYLLHIYDCVRSQLRRKSLAVYQKAWRRSSFVAKKKYSKPVFQPDMAKELAAKHGLGFNPAQMNLLDKLCRWRDVTARREDESALFVAPVHTLYSIVRSSGKARTVEGLFKHCFPDGNIPLILKQHAEELAMLICDALDEDTTVDGNGSQRKEEEMMEIKAEPNVEGLDIIVNSSATPAEKAITTDTLFELPQNDNDSSESDSDNDKESNADVENRSKSIIPIAIADTYTVNDKVVNQEASNKQLCVDPGSLDSSELSEAEGCDQEAPSPDNSSSSPLPTTNSADEISSKHPQIVFNPAPALKKQKSTLLGSDSEESSDEDNGNPAVAMLASENVKMDETATETLITTSIVSNDSDQTARLEAVSNIRQQMTTEIRNHVITPSDFVVETDQKKEEQLMPNVKPEPIIQDEIEFKSIKQEHFKPANAKMSKRKPGGSNDKDDDDGIDLEKIIKPFDYSSSSGKLGGESSDGNKRKKVERFDPMRKKQNKKRYDRPQARKRRAVQPRSMTFN